MPTNQTKQFLGAHIWLPALLVAVVGIAAAFINPSIGVDEGYTIDFIRGSYARLWAECAADVHPPLYFALLKFWADACSIIGIDAITAANLFSTLPVVLVCLIGAKYANQLFGTFAAWIFGLCVLAGNLTHYASVLRMYTLAGLWVFMACFCAAQIVKQNTSPNKSAYWGLTFFTACAAYTHYFACVSVSWAYLAAFFVLLVQKRIREAFGLVGAGLLAIILYLPWAPSLYSQLTTVHDDYWIRPIGIKDVILCIGKPFATEKSVAAYAIGGIFAVTIGLAALCGIVCWFKALQQHNFICAQGAALLFVGAAPFTVLFGTVISNLFRPVFVARYMVPAIPAFFFGLAGLAGSLKKPALQKIITAALSLCALASCVNVLHTEVVQRKNIDDFYRLKDEVIVDEPIFDTISHLRETYFFIRPEWNHLVYDQLEDVLPTLEKSKHGWLFTYGEHYLKELEDAGVTVEYYGRYHVWEYDFNVYTLTMQ